MCQLVLIFLQLNFLYYDFTYRGGMPLPSNPDTGPSLLTSRVPLSSLVVSYCPIHLIRSSPQGFLSLKPLLLCVIDIKCYAEFVSGRPLPSPPDTIISPLCLPQRERLLLPCLHARAPLHGHRPASHSSLQKFAELNIES